VSSWRGPAWIYRFLGSQTPVLIMHNTIGTVAVHDDTVVQFAYRALGARQGMGSPRRRWATMLR